MKRRETEKQNGEQWFREDVYFYITNFQICLFLRIDTLIVIIIIIIILITIIIMTKWHKKNMPSKNVII
jgi:hypothetical protein